ncbi:4Fe-4S ferredoxin [Archaeoglobales archaeon]|nr:MAG: 4Fe-4S ferredoxin [Archaeoglobales archaeon]
MGGNMVEIIVDHEKCTGCGECISVCPAEVYEFNDDGKSDPVNAEDCEECCSCVEVCPEGAITVDVCE